MLIRVCLIVAIVAALAVGVVNFVVVKDRVETLKTNLKTETDAHQEFLGKFTRTKSDLDATNKVLKATQETLTASEQAKDKALSDLAAQNKRADKLNDDLNKTKSERDAAQTELAAYRTAGLTPEQIVAFSKEHKGLQNALASTEAENKVLLQKIKRLNNELAQYKPGAPPVYLPASLTGKVVAFDPKWNFVVLDVGENQGVMEKGELLVSRHGKMVAKVKISSVQKDRSIANLMPGWQLGEVTEGDLVIPAYPES